jgi:hypothetical protein
MSEPYLTPDLESQYTRRAALIEADLKALGINRRHFDDNDENVQQPQDPETYHKVFHILTKYGLIRPHASNT